MSLFSELKRRNVIRVAMAYVVAAWLIIQVVETILPAFGSSSFMLNGLVTPPFTLKFQVFIVFFATFCLSG